MNHPAPSSSSCLNCGATPAGAYCQACGQSTKVHRFTFASLLHEIPHAILHVDRGLFATCKALALHPGATIRAYLDGKRVSFFNPLTLMVLTAGLSALLFSAYPFYFPFTDAGMPPEIAAKFQEFNRLNFKFYSFALIIYLPALALITRLCFARLPESVSRNYGEHLVINAFILGFTTVVMISLFPVLVLVNRTDAFMPIWNSLAAFFFAYHGVVVFLVFKQPGKWIGNLLRSILVVVLYLVLLLVVTQSVFWLYFVKRPL
jgi:hypothetical protein